MSRVVAQTARLRLRTEAPGDRDLWRRDMNLPQVMANLGGPQSDAQIEARFDRMAAGWAQDGFSFLLLERAEDGAMIGHCGLSRILAEQAPAVLTGQVQIGWMLRPDCWGRGYAREAATAVLEMAFVSLTLPIVYGQTSQSNAGSWGLMEKLGMTRRADLDYPDADYPPEDNPTMVYELERRDWRAI